MAKSATKGQKKPPISTNNKGSDVPDKPDHFSKAVALIGLVVTCYTVINALSILANSDVFIDVEHGGKLFESFVLKISVSLAYALLIISCVLIVLAYAVAEKTDFFISFDKEIDELTSSKKMMAGDIAIIFFIAASIFVSIYSIFFESSELGKAVATLIYIIITFSCVLVVAFKGSITVFLIFSKKIRVYLVVTLVFFISLLYGYEFWQSKKTAAEDKHKQVVLAFCKENINAHQFSIIHGVNVKELCDAARGKQESEFLKSAKKIYPDHFEKSVFSE